MVAAWQRSARDRPVSSTALTVRPDYQDKPGRQRVRQSLMNMQLSHARRFSDPVGGVVVAS
jgi:hypothetical protein